MKISQRESNGVTILRIQGQLTLSEGALELRETVNSLLDTDRIKILIDLEEVSYLDSAGLGEIIRCYTTVANRQGQLKLLRLGKKTKSLLTITKLITVFDHYDDEEEALNAFAPRN